MIRRPPRSTPLSLHDALPISRKAEEGLGEVNAIAATIRKGEGSLGKLVRDDEAYHRSEEHTSELQSRQYLVCRLLLEKTNSTPLTGCIPPLSAVGPPGRIKTL